MTQGSDHPPVLEPHMVLKVAVAGHPSDGEDMKTSKSALEGHVSLVIGEG
jgi:hypothetical protein